MHPAASALVFFAVLAGPCAAEGLKLPALDGRFSGDISPLGRTQPSLHWTALARSSNDGSKNIAIAFEGAGATVRAEGQLGGDDTTGPWRITSAQVDLSAWFGAVAEKYFPAAKRLAATGLLLGEGGGQVGENGVSGQLRLDLANGSLTDVENGWSVQELAGSLSLPKFPEWESAPAQRLSFRTLKAGTLTLERGDVRFQIESTRRIRVEGARLDGLGGTMSVGGLVLDLDKSEIEAQLTVNGIDLSALQPYLPQAIVEARGKIDGQFVLRWTAKEGIQFGDGSLHLREGQPSSLRLAAAPGFLSSHVPERINLLPDWMGPLARSVSKAFKAHHTLEAIETGKQMLIVDSVQIELHGASATREAGANVKIVAHPTVAESVRRVRLNVNITGPLADLVRYGLHGQLSFGGE